VRARLVRSRPGTTRVTASPAQLALVEPEEIDVEALAAVYAVVFREPPYSEPDASDLRLRLPIHRERPGFRLVTASVDDEVVGFAYGYTGGANGRWVDKLAARIGAEIAARLLGGHLVLAELAVLPAARGRGLGKALVDAMLRDRTEPRVLLQTHDGDTPAMRLYERAGFQRLAALPPDVALIRDLP
jgi:ribosomal protein S18 acetylase RimI-like enzyme